MLLGEVAAASPLPLPVRFLPVVLRKMSVLAVPSIFGNWNRSDSSMTDQGGCFALGEFAMLVMYSDSSD